MRLLFKHRKKKKKKKGQNVKLKTQESGQSKHSHILSRNFICDELEMKNGNYIPFEVIEGSQ